MSPATVKCPTCGKAVHWVEAERWRPFCSERCRLIDLGAWADGSHAIPGEEAEVQPGLRSDEDIIPH
jgi:Uncharacterized protein conserved in bacteria